MRYVWADYERPCPRCDLSGCSPVSRLNRSGGTIDRQFSAVGSRRLLFTDAVLRGMNEQPECSERVDGAVTSGGLHIHIPGEIMAIPNLSLNERVALASIDENPFTTNIELETTLGLSKRGVEYLIERLKRRGLVSQFRRGRARRLSLGFHVEPRSCCAMEHLAPPTHIMDKSS
jgi:hypothetical protein